MFVHIFRWRVAASALLVSFFLRLFLVQFVARGGGERYTFFNFIISDCPNDIFSGIIACSQPDFSIGGSEFAGEFFSNLNRSERLKPKSRPRRPFFCRTSARIYLRGESLQKSSNKCIHPLQNMRNLWACSTAFWAKFGLSSLRFYIFWFCVAKLF